MPVRMRGPNVLIRDDTSGPGLDGLWGGGGRGGGCLGGGGCRSLPGSLWSQQKFPFLHLVGTGTITEGGEQRDLMVVGRHMPGQLITRRSGLARLGGGLGGRSVLSSVSSSSWPGLGLLGRGLGGERVMQQRPLDI